MNRRQVWVLIVVVVALAAASTWVPILPRCCFRPMEPVVVSPGQIDMIGELESSRVEFARVKPLVISGVRIGTVEFLEPSWVEFERIDRVLGDARPGRPEPGSLGWTTVDPPVIHGWILSRGLACILAVGGVCALLARRCGAPGPGPTTGLALPTLLFLAATSTVLLLRPVRSFVCNFGPTELAGLSQLVDANGVPVGDVVGWMWFPHPAIGVAPAWNAPSLGRHPATGGRRVPYSRVAEIHWPVALAEGGVLVLFAGVAVAWDLRRRRKEAGRA